MVDNVCLNKITITYNNSCFYERVYKHFLIYVIQNRDAMIGKRQNTLLSIFMRNTYIQSQYTQNLTSPCINNQKK